MADANGGPPSNGPSAPARGGGRGGYKLPTMGRGAGAGAGAGGAPPAEAAPPAAGADMAAQPVPQMENLSIGGAPPTTPDAPPPMQAPPMQAMHPQQPGSGGHPGFAAQGTPTAGGQMPQMMTPQQIQQMQAQMTPQQLAQWQQQQHAMHQHMMAQMQQQGSAGAMPMHPGQMMPGMPPQMVPYQGVKCGVGLSFHPDESGQYKITGIRPNSPAAACPMLHVGDVLLKVNGVSITQKSVQEIIDMVMGPPNTQVQLTLQAQYGFPHVMTAPFQELPFDHKREKREKEKKKKGKKGSDGLAPENRLFGGGTLPPGFEHLESLRSAQPYTTPSLSVRTVTLNRQLPTQEGPPQQGAAGQQPRPPAVGTVPQVSQKMGIRDVNADAQAVGTPPPPPASGGGSIPEGSEEVP